MPNLERLSLEEMRALKNMLRALIDVGDVLADYQFAAVFDLSPGQSPMIHLTGCTMPHAWTADEQAAKYEAKDEAKDEAKTFPWEREVPAQTEEEIAREAAGYALWLKAQPAHVRAEHASRMAACLVRNNPVTAPAEQGAEAAEGPGPGEPAAPVDATPAGAAAPDTMPPAAPPPAADGTAGTAPEQTAASPAGVTDPDGGGGAVAAATPAASSLATTAWTEAEDEALIGHVVRLVMAGSPKKAAMHEAARLIGRPAEGATYRLYQKLKARLDAALQLAARAEFERNPIPLPPSGPGAAAAPPAASGALLNHLAQIPATHGGRKWTHQTDLDLVTHAANGLTPAEIATDLQLHADQVKLRLHLLLGRWPAAEVLAAMQMNASKEA